MVIINTTFVIQNLIQVEVLDWIKAIYIPSAVHCRAQKDKTVITKILNSTDVDSESFAVHLWFETMEHALDWDKRFGSRLRSNLQKNWGDRAMAFHTYMGVTE